MPLSAENVLLSSHVNIRELNSWAVGFGTRLKQFTGLKLEANGLENNSVISQDHVKEAKVGAGTMN